MVRVWNTVSHLGLDPAMEKQQKLTVLLANRLAVILFILNALTAAVIVWVYAWSSMVLLVLGNNIAYVMVLLFNYLGYSSASRLMLSLFLPLSTLAITLWGKSVNPLIEESSFYSSRVVLLVASILPLMLFQLKERRLLYAGLTASAFCLLFYDLIHYLFGLGYYQAGFQAPGYRFFNLVVLIVYVLLVSGFLYYKKMLENAERELRESHEQLQRFYAELGMQHEEIYAQTEKLLESQQQLQEANDHVAHQKSLLEAENVELHQYLLEKNKILESSNEQLQGRLEELRQFSYTISHNLRGPVANILGLSSLFDFENGLPKNRELMIHTRTAAAALDAVIRDLSHVLQMRDAKEGFETINLEGLLKNLLLSLKNETAACQVQIEDLLEVKEVQGVKAYLHSILYNLLSNALKYRDPQRPCKIRISCCQDGGGVLLEVKDNGIGIDMERHGTEMFKMYKRFHGFREGRGLGLYLIKTQAELLGGYVDVNSHPGQGSTFRIWLPQPKHNQQSSQSQPSAQRER